MVSLGPYVQFVKAVGGSRVEVKSMIPPGMGDGGYEPTPRDLVFLSQSKLYFLNGLIPFEKAHLAQFKDLNPDLKLIDTSKGLDLIRSSHHHDGEDGADPHVWMSPKEVEPIIFTICSALCEIDPDRKEEYTANRNSYLLALKKWDTQVKSILAKRKCKAFFIYHPYLSYFARDYGLNQISIEFEGKNPTAWQMKQLVMDAKKYSIHAVLMHRQASKEQAESFAKAIEANVIEIDPLALDFGKNMIDIAKAISSN